MGSALSLRARSATALLPSAIGTRHTNVQPRARHAALTAFLLKKWRGAPDRCRRSPRRDCERGPSPAPRTEAGSRGPHQAAFGVVVRVPKLDRLLGDLQPLGSSPALDPHDQQPDRAKAEDHQHHHPPRRRARPVAPRARATAKARTRNANNPSRCSALSRTMRDPSGGSGAISEAKQVRLGRVARRR